eukprot:TRINITY_DN542_c0_g1_i1.p1 TRINITY_DN542_c0_g1~~TRINITY_DN542_c0_g1_i1.p1  ORF type:complete len:277 (-),score=28.61 TRINITY_DN542_c0_g1_i1:31-861(-)
MLSGHRSETSTGEKSVTIYLFHITKMPLLLIDRAHQSVSFPEIVVALQTQREYTQSHPEFQCGERFVTIDQTDATRSVLASLLQSVWGLSPIYQTWNPVRGEVNVDYTWAIGKTPFGSLSDSVKLNFHARYSAVSLPLFSLVNTTITTLIDLLEHFEQYELDVHELLEEGEYLRYVQRWNMLMFKLNEAINFVSLGKFNATYSYVNSMKHDASALIHLSHDASTRSYSYLSCNKAPSSYQTKLWAGPILTLVLVLGGIVYFFEKSFFVSALKKKIQ